MSYIHSKTSTYHTIKKDMKLLQLRSKDTSKGTAGIKPAQEWLEKLKSALEN